jgi:hypothetical protein
VPPPLPLQARRKAHRNDERAVHREECGRGGRAALLRGGPPIGCPDHFTTDASCPE